MSVNFEKVKTYYDKKLWNKSQVIKAVNKWITPDEFKIITGEDFTLYHINLYAINHIPNLKRRY